MRPRSVWLIANPRSGRKAGFTVNAVGPDEALVALARQGVAAELRTTERPGHATLLARQAVAAGVDVVVAAGGDGTVREVAAGLIGCEATLAILPLGSMMNLARALGIPRDLDAAAALISDGTAVQMDVGRARTPAGETIFLEGAGVGLEAGLFAYTSRLDERKWRYLVPFLRFLARYRPRSARVTVDGRGLIVRRAASVSVAVSPYIGLALNLAPGAKLDDRQLDVVVRQSSGPIDLLRHALAVVLGAPQPPATTIRLRGGQVVVEHRRVPMFVHADGQLAGRTPVTFDLLPGGLCVVANPPAVGITSASLHREVSVTA